MGTSKEMLLIAASDAIVPSGRETSKMARTTPGESTTMMAAGGTLNGEEDTSEVVYASPNCIGSPTTPCHTGFRV